MEAIAKTRHLKGSPRKARLVIDLIRGRNVSQALAILKFTDKRAADPIEKTLRSAIANATFQAEKQNIAVDPDDLFVKTCFVDMGAHKNRSRMRPAPQGRAFREHRHYCHITIMVSSDLPVAGDDDKSKRKANLAAGRKASGGERKSKTSVKGTAVTQEKKTKKAAVKETEKDEAIIENPSENTNVAAPIVISDPVALAEGTGGQVMTEAVETNEPTINAAQTESANEADAANAKDTTTQRTAELHETSMADEAQLDTNEELERQ